MTVQLYSWGAQVVDKSMTRQSDFLPKPTELWLQEKKNDLKVLLLLLVELPAAPANH